MIGVSEMNEISLKYVCMLKPSINIIFLEQLAEQLEIDDVELPKVPKVSNKWDGEDADDDIKVSTIKF
jgi:hypothetical protein